MSPSGGLGLWCVFFYDTKRGEEERGSLGDLTLLLPTTLYCPCFLTSGPINLGLMCVCTKYQCNILGKRVDLMQYKVSHCIFQSYYSPIRGQGDDTSSHAMGMLSLSVMAVLTEVYHVLVTGKSP